MFSPGYARCSTGNGRETLALSLISKRRRYQKHPERRANPSYSLFSMAEFLHRYSEFGVLLSVLAEGRVSGRKRRFLGIG